MGINDRENDRREKKRDETRQRKARVQSTVSIENVDLEALAYCVHHITQAGGAIRIGHTRDHGAWAIGVYGDGTTPYTEYVRPDEDFDKYLRGLGDFFAEKIAPDK